MDSVRSLVRHPSAFFPMAMSVLALAVVLSAVAEFGIDHMPKDEEVHAHIWQLLMAGQIPVIGFFAIKWLPRAARAAFCVLALQVGAALTAVAPVFLLKL